MYQPPLQDTPAAPMRCCRCRRGRKRGNSGWNRRCLYQVPPAGARGSPVAGRRADHGVRWNETAQRFRGRATVEGEFSNITRSYAGKGVVRYAW